MQCRLLGRILCDVGILEAVGLVCGCFPRRYLVVKRASLQLVRVDAFGVQV